MENKKLVSYEHTPQVCGLEYSEQRDLALNPQKKKYYDDLVKARTRMGKVKDK